MTRTATTKYNRFKIAEKYLSLSGLCTVDIVYTNITVTQSLQIENIKYCKTL